MNYIILFSSFSFFISLSIYSVFSCYLLNIRSDVVFRREYEEFAKSQLQHLGLEFHVRAQGQKLTVCLLGLLKQLKARLPAFEPLRRADLSILKEAC